MEAFEREENGPSSQQEKSFVSRAKKIIVVVHDHSDQFDFETYLPRVRVPGHGVAVKQRLRMRGLATYNVIVRDGHLVSEERVDLPEGTKLTAVHDEEMSAEELAALDASLDRAAGQVRKDQVRPARELIAELRARR